MPCRPIAISVNPDQYAKVAAFAQEHFDADIRATAGFLVASYPQFKVQIPASGEIATRRMTYTELLEMREEENSRIAAGVAKKRYNYRSSPRDLNKEQQAILEAKAPSGAEIREKRTVDGTEFEFSFMDHHYVSGVEHLHYSREAAMVECAEDKACRIAVFDEAKVRLNEAIRVAMARNEEARRRLSLGAPEEEALRGGGIPHAKELQGHLLLPSDDEGRARRKGRKR